MFFECPTNPGEPLRWQLRALTCALRSDPIARPLPRHVLVLKAAGIPSAVSRGCWEAGDGEGSGGWETPGWFVGKRSLWSGGQRGTAGRSWGGIAAADGMVGNESGQRGAAAGGCQVGPSDTPGPSATLRGLGCSRTLGNPGPSATPRPLVAPGPSATPGLLVAPGPTVTPGPSATPRPLGSPTVTPGPAATLRPSATLGPLDIPGPSVTLGPSATPGPLVAPEPTATP
uniref:Uncharacterized protein n=1 Tax=Strix occidentalis caurina TaxID=311401 RepID=A0A8D0FYN6_STROC